MATPVKRIEKEFLLKVLYDEKLPVILLRDSVEHILVLDRPARDTLVFRSGMPTNKLSIGAHIDLMFDYWGKAIVFNTEIINLRDGMITCSIPEFLYKNLVRSYSRVRSPSRMQIQFSFLGDRYHLDFPKVFEFEDGDAGEFIKNVDPGNISGLIGQMAAWIKTHASSYRLVFFKETKPKSIEERVVAEMGKTLFLPSTKNGFPLEDPFPRRRIITGEMFSLYLEGTGMDNAYTAGECERFVRSKEESGLASDAWIPVLFQEYVIGYIHVWLNKDDEKPLFNYELVETLYQFAKVLSYSLKINGYFEQGKLRNNTFEGKIIDVSASGLLFAYPYSDLSSALLPDSELNVKIITPQRRITVVASIVRRFRDNNHGYYGCRFHELTKDNLAYLFECIYGKPFTDSDAAFLSGQV